uniref:Hemerythrin-like domain-containing protein n=1 Tax=Dechloromonas aromatica (strain RCB) TaxID=159087 RepID=Q47FG4_DECAR
MTHSPTWSDDLSVGNYLIDGQHKRLVSLCARAADCASATSPEALREFHNILNDLAKLTDEDFKDEEVLLIKNGCPNVEAHIAEHNVYREMVVNLLFDGTAGLLDRAKLYHVANDYLTKHIIEMDLADKAYLKK